MQIEIDKAAAQKYKETVLKNAESKTTKDAYEAMMAPIRVYDSLIISMACGAVGAIVSLLALIFGLLKKSKLAKVFNLLGVLTLVGTLIAGAIAFTGASAMLVSLTVGSLVSVEGKTIASILLILVGAVGTLVGGLTTVLGRK